jgi:hypothetical protein
MKGQISTRDYELLSASLDGQLSPREAARLQARLHSSPELRLALEDLQKTRMLLRSLPAPRRRRSFVLSPQMVAARPARFPRLFPAFSLASALSSLLLVLVLLGDFLGLAPRAVQYAAPAAPEAVAMQAGSEIAAGDAAMETQSAEPPTETATLLESAGLPATEAVSKTVPGATEAPLAALPPEPSPSPMDIVGVAAGAPELTPTLGASQDISAPRTLSPTATQTLDIITATVLITDTPSLTATPTGEQAMPSSLPSPDPTQPGLAQPFHTAQPSPSHALPPGPPAQPLAPSPTLRIVEVLLGLLAVGSGLAAFWLRQRARQ